MSEDYSGYNPDDKTINITQTGSDFVRVLGHELTHYYDQIKREKLTLARDNFDDIINREMDESEATAASFIIRRQIMANHDEHPDIGISNRINDYDPDPERDMKKGKELFVALFMVIQRQFTCFQPKHSAGKPQMFTLVSNKHYEIYSSWNGCKR